MKGRFISIEGTEGAGKSTHIRRLARWIESRGHRVVLVREPGGTKLGEWIRGTLQHDAVAEPITPEAELFLFEAARAQLVRQVIRPVLERGDWVISDRFMDSTTAYQGYGRGFDIDQVLALHRVAVGDTVPDLTILLDLDVAEGFRRLQKRNAAGKLRLDRFEREARRFHETVRRGFKALARRFPERMVVVKAAGTEAEVGGRVEAVVARRLGLDCGKQGKGTGCRSRKQSKA